MGKTLKKDNTCVIALIMFYENRKSLIFKVLGVVVYCFSEIYICVDYLSLQKEENMSLSHRVFEDTSFYELSGMVIPKLLLNIVSCYGFFQDDNSLIDEVSQFKLYLVFRIFDRRA